MRPALDGVSAASLRTIAEALRSGNLACPFSALSLKRVVGACPELLAAELTAMSGDGIKAQHLAMLIDALAETVEARLSTAAELVWTGPETAVAQSRDTSVVLAGLFQSAQHSVVISTFVLQDPSVVFRPLIDRMSEVPELKVQLFVNIARGIRDTRHESELLREFATNLRRSWPGNNRPTLFYDPRSLSFEPDQRATWHAKVVVVDDEVSFVTSANFTEWAQQKNVEAGVLVRNSPFARQLRHQFESLVEARAVVEVPGFR